MMKWNSSKTYTEDDMLRMQQDAVSRVRDFQTRARDAASFYDVPVSAIEDVREESADEPAIFAQASANDAFGSEQDPAFTEPDVIEAESRVITPTQQHLLDPIHKILGDLNLDSEALLVIGLMFLLYNEQADGVLLLALAYLLL